MTQRLDSANTTLEVPTEKTRRFGGRVVLFCVLGWTVVVAVALWWLLVANAEPSLWIVRKGESAQSAAPDKFHAFFKSDGGFNRVYPWILFGPYAGLLAMCFPLERGRLRLGVPINLAACAAFLAAAHAIDSRTGTRFANVTIISSRIDGGLTPADWDTNAVRIEVSGARAGDIVQEQTMIGFATQMFTTSHIAGMAVGGWGEIPKSAMTNLFARENRPFGPPLPPHAMPTMGGWPTILDFVAYAAVFGLAHWVHFYRRFRERERRAIVLESNLANAHLGALRAQLQPHFLFNSLNAVAALLRRDPRLAEATLMSLSDLLRLTLNQSERQEISLREEMEFIQRYLDIQQTRFGDKLRVEQNIEPAALECLVPSLLLQPLVENAIRHGIEPAENAGLVRLAAHRRDGRLAITVEDNGVGFNKPAIDLPSAATTAAETNGAPLAVAPRARVDSRGKIARGTGIGLANLRARLEMLYGSQQKLDLTPRREGGVTVEIEIPWRAATSLESPGPVHRS